MCQVKLINFCRSSTMLLLLRYVFCLTAEETVLLETLNKIRKDEGLPNLAINKALTKTSKLYSSNMAKNERLRARFPVSDVVMRKLNYDRSPWLSLREVLAQNGYDTKTADLYTWKVEKGKSADFATELESEIRKKNSIKIPGIAFVGFASSDSMNGDFYYNLILATPPASKDGGQEEIADDQSSGEDTNVQNPASNLTQDDFVFSSNPENASEDPEKPYNASGPVEGVNDSVETSPQNVGSLGRNSKGVKSQTSDREIPKPVGKAKTNTRNSLGSEKNKDTSVKPKKGSIPRKPGQAVIKPDQKLPVPKKSMQSEMVDGLPNNSASRLFQRDNDLVNMKALMSDFDTYQKFMHGSPFHTGHLGTDFAMESVEDIKDIGNDAIKEIKKLQKEAQESVKSEKDDKSKDSDEESHPEKDDNEKSNEKDEKKSAKSSNGGKSKEEEKNSSKKSKDDDKSEDLVVNSSKLGSIELNPFKNLLTSTQENAEGKQDEQQKDQSGDQKDPNAVPNAEAQPAEEAQGSPKDSNPDSNAHQKHDDKSGDQQKPEDNAPDDDKKDVKPENQNEQVQKPQETDDKEKSKKEDCPCAPKDSNEDGEKKDEKDAKSQDKDQKPPTENKNNKRSDKDGKDADKQENPKELSDDEIQKKLNINPNVHPKIPVMESKKHLVPRKSLLRDYLPNVEPDVLFESPLAPILNSNVKEDEASADLTNKKSKENRMKKPEETEQKVAKGSDLGMDALKIGHSDLVTNPKRAQVFKSHSKSAKKTKLRSRKKKVSNLVSAVRHDNRVLDSKNDESFVRSLSQFKSSDNGNSKSKSSSKNSRLDKSDLSMSSTEAKDESQHTESTETTETPKIRNPKLFIEDFEKEKGSIDSKK